MSEYVRTSKSFQHKSQFKGNTYQLFREELCRLQDTSIRAQYDEYMAYLGGADTEYLSDSFSPKYRDFVNTQL